tara:strand:- start:107 stop:1561 length:1455 start_codon:yes stop_codon:yes gene_type:complete
MNVIKKKERLEIIVEDIVYGGNGINKSAYENYIIFIKNGIEGQKVLVEVQKVKTNYVEAKIIEVLKKSPLQKKRNYQKISGSPYYDLDISYQKNKKIKLVFKLFEKIGKIENIENYYDTFIPSPKTWHYRNKMEYAFSSIIYDQDKKTDIDGFGLGFKKANTWWMVENLNKDSGLFDKEWENYLCEIRECCKKTGLPAWNIPQKKGFFRNLNVRKSYKKNELLIELVTSSNGIKQFNNKNFINTITSRHKDRIAGIIHTVNDEISDRLNYHNVTSKTIFKSNKISEGLLNLNFEISMSSFFQTNPLCAEKLYQKVIEYACEKNKDEKQTRNKYILDLFCGTGTIGQMIASQQTDREIIGVDIIESAIQNAKESAIQNKIKNIQFYALDIKTFLIEKPELKNQIETIIIDPPRPGVSKKSLNKIIELNAAKIIYVSCNPSTQARDVQILIENGYSIRTFSVADQFPHTHHIETIFILIKSSDDVS